jgi:sugar/nucleoside kinase (ribokinase family)
MYDVVTIGSASRDVFLISKAFKIIKSSQFPSGYGECVSLGSKIEIDQMILTTGGGATNAAATFAQLGFDVGVVARIGDDAPGLDVEDDLEMRGADTSLLRTIKRGNTAYSTLLTATNGERTVLVHRGVSLELSIRDITKSKLKTKWLYISSVGGDVSMVMDLALWAKKNDVNVAYNPGSLEIKNGMRAFSKLIPLLTVLNLNLEEAQMLSGIKSKDIRRVCKKLHTGDATIIVTDGSKGAYAHAKGETYFVKTRNIKSVSRTGAGDAFGSGLVAALIKGHDIEYALKVGTINAEAVILEHGAKNGLLKKWPSKKTIAEISYHHVK